MSKPASGATVNGNALATSLLAVWYIAENSGTSVADSTGNGHGLTLDASVTWGTDSNGDVDIVEATASKRVAAVANPFTLAGTGSWSIAWRGLQTASGTSGMVIGDDTNESDFVWMDGGSHLRFRSSNSTDYDFAITDFSANDDYELSYDQPGAKLHLYHNGTEVGTGISVTSNDAALSVNSVGSGYDTSDAFSLVGKLTYLYVWSGRALSSSDASTLHSTPYVFLTAGSGSITLTTPVAYHVYAETSGTGNVTISGTYTGSPTTIEYQVDSGSWTTLIGSPVGGTYSQAVAIATGTHTLGVRFSNATSTTASVSNILIGDVYLVAGQSNADGRFTNHQTYSNATQKAGEYPLGGGWKQLADPTNTTTSIGSVWPPLATQLLADKSYPAGFILTAVGGTSLYVDWAAFGGTDSQQAENTATSAGGNVKAVLWQQGESDAIAGRNDYQNNLQQLALDFHTSVAGSPILIASPLAPLTPAITTAVNVDAVMKATIAAWSYQYIKPGPLMHDQVTGSDGEHWDTDAKAATWAGRWWVCIKAALDSVGSGRGPRVNSMTLNTPRTQITVLFDQTLKTGLTFGAGAWAVSDNGSPATVSSIAYAVNPSGIVLTLSTALIGPANTCIVTFGSGDKAAGIVVPLSTDYNLPSGAVVQLPAEPIFAFTCAEASHVQAGPGPMGVNNPRSGALATRY